MDGVADLIPPTEDVDADSHEPAAIEDDGPRCVICLVNILQMDRLVLLVPCGHQNQCRACVDVLLSRPIPEDRRCAFNT